MATVPMRHLRSICLSMALESFFRPWPLFHFHNPIHSRWDPLDKGSARRKAATYTQNNTNTEKPTHTNIYDLSGIRTYYPIVSVGEDGYCHKPRGHFDRQSIFS
jgi:hypothetical protein